MMKNSNKILTLVIGLLLVSNIVLVYFMVNGSGKKPSKKDRMDPAEIMIKEVGMDEQQAATHKQMKDDHFKAVRPLYDSLRTAKATYFGLVKDASVTDSVGKMYREKIAVWQNTIDSMTFAHFRKMRNLLNPQQQVKYDEFVQKLMQRGRKDSAAKSK
ncbi:MAG TPA: hypothetical protein PLL23_00790 [Chitinophagaceae bacterium]|nr:hypothetical protein [Chitinophagaceae bacterium]